MCSGYINSIIKSSIVDGPGNRIAIFMQGCNFDCWYCHNPETINLCNGCRKCLDKCKYNALVFKNGIEFDKVNCVDCNECSNVCTYDSTPRTMKYSAEELYDEISMYFDFVEGVTFSGGEALLQQRFILEVIKLIKSNSDLNCIIDTNGSVEIMPEILELTDKFILDIKHVNDLEHIKLTGLSNVVVLKNFKVLQQLNKLYEVRTVMYPGVNHSETVEFVLNHIQAGVNYKQITYHDSGVRSKYKDAYNK